MNNTKLSFDEASLVFAMRSRTVKDIKCNIKTFSQNDKMCPLCMKAEDTQEHCMECPKMKNIQKQFENHIQYNHIFSNSGRRPLPLHHGDQPASEVPQLRVARVPN